MSHDENRTATGGFGWAICLQDYVRTVQASCTSPHEAKNRKVREDDLPCALHTHGELRDRTGGRRVGGQSSYRVWVTLSSSAHAVCLLSILDSLLG
jgi:hypothetical protein